MRPFSSPAVPAPWTRDLNRRRIAHEADLLNDALEIGIDQLKRQAQQCRNLRRARDAMLEMVGQMDDEEEIEKLAGGPVVMVTTVGGRAA